jgi:hypothetical protein
MGLKQSKQIYDSRFYGVKDYDMYKERCDNTANDARLRDMIMSTVYENENFYCYLSTNLSYENTCLILPKQVFFEKITDEEECEDNCSVCLEKLVDKRNNPVVKISKCGHKFHYNCIKDTLKHCGERCPLCRQGPDLEKVKDLKERMTWRADSYSSYDED